MYKFLEGALEFAENVGDISYVVMTNDDSVWGNRIKICGESNGGGSFELILTIKDGAEDA